MHRVFCFFFSVVRYKVMIPSAFNTELNKISSTSIGATYLINTIYSFLLLNFCVEDSTSSIIISGFTIKPTNTQVRNATPDSKSKRRRNCHQHRINGYTDRNKFTALFCLIHENGNHCLHQGNGRCQCSKQYQHKKYRSDQVSSRHTVKHFWQCNKH